VQVTLWFLEDWERKYSICHPAAIDGKDMARQSTTMNKPQLSSNTIRQQPCRRLLMELPSQKQQQEKGIFFEE
jgi:hypothetical protein